MADIIAIFIKRVLLFFALLPAFNICSGQVTAYDGFETPGLSKIWSSDRMVSNSFEIQSDIVRNGHSAAKITLIAGDVFEKGLGTSLDSERDELREADRLVSLEGRSYEYQFSLFLPENFPVVPTRLVIAQWKQNCGSGAKCSDDSPVLAVRYSSGRLYVTVQTDSGTNKVYQTKEEIRNKWLDFKFKIHFTRLYNGSVEAWLNNDKIIDYTGQTAYSAEKGYQKKSYFYFKTGLYRDLMSQPMSIYIDEYSKKELKQ